MKDKLYILLLLTVNLLLITFGKALDSKSIFQTANTYYQNKQYEEAENSELGIRRSCRSRCDGVR